MPKDKIVIRDDGTHFYLGGREVSEEAYREYYPAPRGGVESVTVGADPGASFVQFKPIVSDALAVHPALREEAIEDAKRKGVPTEFTFEGQPVLRTRAHRAAYLKAYGYHDNSGCYGD